MLSRRWIPAWVAERLDALDDELDGNPEGALRAVCDDLVDEEDAADVDLDDALDALALALTVAGSEDDLQTLPPEAPTDEAGLPMQIVYRGEVPLAEEETATF